MQLDGVRGKRRTTRMDMQLDGLLVVAPATPVLVQCLDQLDLQAQQSSAITPVNLDVRKRVFIPLRCSRGHPPVHPASGFRAAAVFQRIDDADHPLATRMDMQLDGVRGKRRKATRMDMQLDGVRGKRRNPRINPMRSKAVSDFSQSFSLRASTPKSVDVGVRGKRRKATRMDMQLDGVRGKRRNPRINPMRSKAVSDFSQSFSLRASTPKSVDAAQSLRLCKDHV